MKIISALPFAAALLGITLILQANPVRAEANPETCAAWETGCQQGNLTDCSDYKIFCASGRSSELGINITSAFRQTEKQKAPRLIFIN